VLAVRWYLRFGVSYRDAEELLIERGIEVDHVTVYRWVQRFTPLLADAARPCRHAVGERWFVDETYVKVAGRWRYVYRAVDQFAATGARARRITGIDVGIWRRGSRASRVARVAPRSHRARSTPGWRPRCVGCGASIRVGVRVVSMASWRAWASCRRRSPRSIRRCAGIHLVADQPPRRPKALTRFEREVTNDLWQIDATEVRLADQHKAYVLDVIDDHSRYLLAAIAADSPTGEAACDCFEEAASRYGLPRQVLSDNGLCFTGRLHGVTVEFERSLTELDVELINSTAYLPETLGKLERFHRTLKEWLTGEGPACDLAHLQELLDGFRFHYNRERPHQAIGNLTPARALPAARANRGRTRDEHRVRSTRRTDLPAQGDRARRLGGRQAHLRQQADPSRTTLGRNPANDDSGTAGTRRERRALIPRLSPTHTGLGQRNRAPGENDEPSSPHSLRPSTGFSDVLIPEEPERLTEAPMLPDPRVTRRDGSPRCTVGYGSPGHRRRWCSRQVSGVSHVRLADRVHRMAGR
jgi:transposase InsO family protein